MNAVERAFAVAKVEDNPCGVLGFRIFGRVLIYWIPACAGMTREICSLIFAFMLAMIFIILFDMKKNANKKSLSVS